MATKQAKQASRRWIIVAVCVVALVVAGTVVYLNLRPSKTASNYTECTRAGGIVAETYPEQCTINNKTFTNTSADPKFQLPPVGDKPSTTEPNSFVGLSEQAALDKAKSENRPARVIKRDGQDLPATMDYIKGRLNLTISNGKVEKVDIE